MMAAILPRQPSFPESPSQLAVSLANIHLDDRHDESQDDSSTYDAQVVRPGSSSSTRPSDPSAITEQLTQISEHLEKIRFQFFTIQEKRHAGIFALVDDPNAGREHSPAVSEKSIALDLEMARLTALMEEASNRLQSTEKVMQSMDEMTPKVDRRSSITSLSSLISFDEDFGVGSIATVKKPADLRRQLAALLEDWSAIQKEAKTLEEELRGDKYVIVFNSIGDQLAEMMDSLDKALASCHDFVFACNQERAQGETGRDTDLTSWQSNEERLATLQTVKRSFNVKRSSYGPACEQMFTTLEKGVKQHSTKNGTILRRFAELKTRWRALRERVARMDKELKRIEAHLTDFSPEMVHEAASLTPSRSKDGLARQSSPLVSGSTPRKMLRGTPSSVDRSSDRYASPTSSYLSPSASNIVPLPRRSSLSPQSQPPPMPSRSPNRYSMMTLHTSPRMRPSDAERLRSASLAGGSPLTQHQSATASQIPTEIGYRRSSLTPSSSPPTSFPRDRMIRKQNSAYALHNGHSSGATLASENLSRSLRADDSPSAFRATSRDRAEFRRSQVGDEGLEENEEMLMDMTEEQVNRSPTRARSSSKLRQSRPIGATTDAVVKQERPSSVTGMYPRPSSSLSQADSTYSKIPRLSRRSTIFRNQDDRPESALSFTSNSTAALGRSPEASRIRSSAMYDGPSRLAMQTPEPTIMARVQRMSMFGGISKRNSRPPPTKFNANSHPLPSQTSSSMGSSTSATPSNRHSMQGVTTSKPLNVVKRKSAVWSNNGRTTPLSAAALAKVPQAGIDMTSSSISHSPPTSRIISSGSTPTSSVYNHRPRASMVGSSYAPSARSGRETPTYSDGGHSSVWGGTNHGGRPASRMQSGHHGLYRPNPNDAIDLEVARIVNALGVSLERIDPPLARGVKDLDPSNSTLVRYQVGGKVIVCKLLQLHRATGANNGEPKAKKILTRVGGGWIDLEQYLLSRMGTM